MPKIKKLKQQIDEMQSVEQLMKFFEIDYDSSFLNEHGNELIQRFSGSVIIRKPEDWFDYRYCLKNTYCRIQRSLRPKGGRSACRGCTSCERR